MNRPGKLINTNSSSYEYVTAIFPEIKKFTEILTSIHIKDFGYLRIYPDGSYLHLSTNLNYVQTFLREISNEGEFFTTIMSTIMPGKLHHSILPSDINLFHKSKDEAVHILHRFNMWDILSVYSTNTNHEFIECYYFSPNCERKYAALFFTKNLLLINHFIYYFNEVARDLINVNDRKKLAKFDQKFIYLNRHQNPFVSNQEIGTFLANTEHQNVISFKNGLVSLSEKDLKCLYYIGKGFSAKQIARTMGNFSPRTIEGWITGLKDKTGLNFKSDLVSEFMNNEKLKEAYEISKLKERTYHHLNF